MSFLCVRNLTAGYGSSQALFGVDMAMAEGEVMALMGRNGMGKTTTVKAICRMIDSEGTLTLDGRNLQTLPSHKVARLGIGLAPEGRRCFPGLTVGENLVAAARPGNWTVQTVTDLFPRLGERVGQPAASLSGGEQQMLAMARALCLDPRILLLDEPTEGLMPAMVRAVAEFVRQLMSMGVSVIMVEQRLDMVKMVADRICLMDGGTIVKTLSIEELPSSMEAIHRALSV